MEVSPPVESSKRGGVTVALRDLVILMASGAVGMLAAVPTWIIVNHLLAGIGGPLTPVSLALVAGASVFAKSARALGGFVS
jgi:hypothetical protein